MTLRAAFEDQAVSCERLDPPFMGHLLRILSENWQSDTKLGKAMTTYTGNTVPLAIRYHCILPMGFMLWFSQVDRTR